MGGGSSLLAMLIRPRFRNGTGGTPGGGSRAGGR